MIGPAEMAEVPDDLGAFLACGLHYREEAREIVLAGNGFVKMPANGFASDTNAFGRETLIILQREGVMLGGGDEVQAFSRAPDMSGTLETRHEKRIKKRGTRDRFDCMRLSPIHKRKP